MQIQTSVVQINGSHRSLFVITYKHFCVSKSRRIFIDFHSRLYKFTVISSGNTVGISLIRYSRHNNFNINTTLCCELQRSHHNIIYNKVWCNNMQITVCRIYNVQINRFTNSFIVKRLIGISYYITIIGKVFGNFNI